MGIHVNSKRLRRAEAAARPAISHRLDQGTSTDSEKSSAFEFYLTTMLQRYETESPIDPEELRASLYAVTRGDVSAANYLRERKAYFLRVDDAWNAARVAVDLSVYFIRQKEYESAAEEARFSIRVFDECEDEYGLNIAKLNLMSALSGIPSEAART